MNTILVLGAGPAAVATSILLRQLGHDVRLVGKNKKDAFLEGASPRVVEGLRRVGCSNALRVLTDRRSRLSLWGERPKLANSEYVVDRKALDSALWLDAQCAGVSTLKARVRQVMKTPEGWMVIATDPGGDHHHLACRFLVEARGRSAPKILPDEQAECRAISLLRHFVSDGSTPSLTCSEPFEEGWAWATSAVDGFCSVQLVPDPDHLKPNDCETVLDVHQRMYAKLEHLPRLLGALDPAGTVLSRGIQPVRRGGIVSQDYLRVGDAAYCVDPLSGHGMYEAVSGAFAAAPTINTLLRRPQAHAVALRFYEERATRLFDARAGAARHFYSANEQWQHAQFWAARSHSVLQASTALSDVPLFDRRPVIEDGFITERLVLVTRDHPEGIRFVAGIELAGLLCQQGATADLSSVEEALIRLSIPAEQRRTLLIALSGAASA
ncbi:NAD(P)/FAD-dependent oxidoreductase [Pseudomonas sp. xss_2]|uniref:flavin-dependent monooxygenase QhpG n=1 Tax=Pseudomonas sp. xss_2 TaxID=3367215 RepID=UPI00370AB36A